MNRRSALQLLALIPAAATLPAFAQSEPLPEERIVRNSSGRKRVTAPLRPLTHQTIVDIWSNLPGIQYAHDSPEYTSVLSVVYAAMSLQHVTLSPKTDEPTQVSIFDKSGAQIGTTMSYPTQLLWTRGPRNVACAIGCIARTQLAKSMGIECKGHSMADVSIEDHGAVVEAIGGGAFNRLLEQLDSIEFQFQDQPGTRALHGALDRWKDVK